MSPQYHQQQYANKLRHKGIPTMLDPHNKLYWICSVSFRIFLIEKEPSPPLKHAPQGSAWKSLNYLTPPSLNWRNLGPAWKNCWWTQGGLPPQSCTPHYRPHTISDLDAFPNILHSQGQVFSNMRWCPILIPQLFRKRNKSKSKSSILGIDK